MWKKILFAVLGLVVVGAMVGYYFYNLKPSNADDQPAVASLSADDLIRQFELDESGTMAKYQDKVIQVNGMVGEIRIDTACTIVMKAPVTGGTITCGMSTKNAAGNLKEGDPVIIKGYCAGYMNLLGSDVQLNRSAVVTTKK